MKNEAQIRILLLQQYLCTLTDEEHAASVSDILQFWESHGIQAGRKSVYSEIKVEKDAAMIALALTAQLLCQIVVDPLLILTQYIWHPGWPQKCIQRYPDPD